jgi:hydrogenase/urease accessory protein HupE
MALILATMVILWWIAVWGLFDMLILHLTRSEKAILYAILLIGILIILQMNPELINNF